MFILVYRFVCVVFLFSMSKAKELQSAERNVFYLFSLFSLHTYSTFIYCTFSMLLLSNFVVFFVPIDWRDGEGLFFLTVALSPAPLE